VRILVLCHEYPPVGGGGGRVAQDLCRGLAELGHEVQVLTAHWGDLPKKETLDGVIIYRLVSGRRLPYKAGLVAMLGYILASFWAGWALVRRWKPDLIHVHFAVPAGAAALAISKLTGVPYVLTAHLGDVPGGVPEKTGRWFRWFAPLIPPIWKQAAQVVAVSNFTRELAMQHYPVDIQVIPNGVSLEELDPGTICLNQPPRIVFAGRFVPQKNPALVVRSLAGVKDLPWTCVMLGDGILRGEVEGEILTLDLEDRFSLPGWVKPEVVIDWYRKSDILIMTSLSEGFPVVGVQAMGMGLALVLSRVGGNLDLVVQDSKGGFLVDLDAGPAGFALAIRSLLENPEKLLAYRQANRAMAQKFDLRTVVKSYDQIFSQVNRLSS
jgi:glycosyltransferase involved in cell wall biosynthesis